MVFLITLFCTVVLRLLASGWAAVVCGRTAAVPAADAPHVVILRPLSGTFPALRQNLEATLQQSYPATRTSVVFCLASTTDPAWDVVQSVVAAATGLGSNLPAVTAQSVLPDPAARPQAHQAAAVYVSTSRDAAALNPKVANLLPAYSAAPDDSLVWICDASLRPPPDTLSTMVATLLRKRKTGLVHQLPMIAASVGGSALLGAGFEGLCLGTSLAWPYIGLNQFPGVNDMVNGMSNLLRKSDLEAAGGLRAVADFVAEDHYLAQRLAARGLQAVLASLPARQFPPPRSLKAALARLVRWCRLRRTMLSPTLLEPFTFPVTALLLLRFLGQPLVVLVLYAGAVFAHDSLLYTQLTEPRARLTLPVFVGLWLLHQCLQPFLYIYAVSSGRIDWQGHLFDLQADGTATIAN